MSQMGHESPAVVGHLHALGGLKVRITFGVADLPHVDARKGGKTFWKTTILPNHKAGSTERRHAHCNNLGATVAVRPKAAPILDETVGSPSQQETSSHKCRGHQRRRWLAQTND